MKKSIAAIFILALFLAGCGPQIADYQTGRVRINNIDIKVEVADTVLKQSQGLSGRGSLPVNYGMLFPFNNLKNPPFWMGQMKFPLDFIWLKADKVADIDANVPVFDSPGNYASNIASAVDFPDYVIEVGAGFCEKNKIQIGDYVDLLLK